MDLENGNEISKYLLNCLKKYEKDKNIFDKTLHMIELYMKRSDWPNCIEDLEKRAKNIIGEDIITLTWGVGKYVHNSEIKWDGVPEGFKEDYTYFFDAIAELYNQHWYGRFNPQGFYGISYSKNLDNLYQIRLSKNNGEYTDFTMNKNELSSLKNKLEYILKDEK